MHIHRTTCTSSTNCHHCFNAKPSPSPRCCDEHPTVRRHVDALVRTRTRRACQLQKSFHRRELTMSCATTLPTRQHPSSLQSRGYFSEQLPVRKMHGTAGMERMPLSYYAITFSGLQTVFSGGSHPRIGVYVNRSPNSPFEATSFCKNSDVLTISFYFTKL